MPAPGRLELGLVTHPRGRRVPRGLSLQPAEAAAGVPGARRVTTGLKASAERLLPRPALPAPLPSSKLPAPRRGLRPARGGLGGEQGWRPAGVRARACRYARPAGRRPARPRGHCGWSQATLGWGPSCSSPRLGLPVPPELPESPCPVAQARPQEVP